MSGWNFLDRKYKCNHMLCSMLSDRFLGLKKIKGKFQNLPWKNSKCDCCLQEKHFLMYWALLICTATIWTLCLLKLKEILFRNRKMDSHTEIMYTFCIQYKNSAWCMQLIFTKCIPHFNFCIHFLYKLYYIQNINKSLSKCWKHFVYIWHTSILIYKKCIYIIRSIYLIWIQISYKIHANNCMQNVSLISTCFEPFILHFLGNHCTELKLETFRLSTCRLVSNQWNKKYIGLSS